MRFKNLKAGVLAIALAASIPAVAPAQNAGEPVRTEDRRDHTDFGWIGLLGLAGLFGLKRRDREHDTINDRDRVAMNQVR